MPPRARGANPPSSATRRTTSRSGARSWPAPWPPPPGGLASPPSSPLHIGESMREQGVDASTLGLRYGLFGAEPWTEELRHKIEAVLFLTAVDFYGLSEIIGPGGAVGGAGGRNGGGRRPRRGQGGSWPSPRSRRRRCPPSATGRETSRA